MADKRIAILLERDASGPRQIAHELYGLARKLTAEADILALTAQVDAPYPAAAFCQSTLDAVRAASVQLLLIGATPFSKQLAPYLAAKLETGLSAGCTDFCWTPTGALLQIRPAFDGAALAWVLTENSLPRIATVQPGAFARMDIPASLATVALEPMEIPHISLLERRQLPPADDIANASCIIAIGGGLQKREDVELFAKLAKRHGAALACSRALTERGWMPQNKQIGLSGRAVRAELLIAFGIAGSVQFLAGVQHVKQLIAVNNRPDAPIFSVAQQALLGDMYEIAAHMMA